MATPKIKQIRAGLLGLVKASFYLVFLLISSLLLFEAVYRWQVIDFYSNNLKALNEEELSTLKDRPAILVIGDSFSASPDAYVERLRENISSHRIINSAVSGTCIRQHQHFAERRFDQFQPELVIYQIYVGNDLLEYRHPTRGVGISWQRKLYWWIADRFLSIGYINAKLPALRHTIVPAHTADYSGKAEQGFDPDNYSARTKMLFQAEPSLLEHSIQMIGKRQQDAELLTSDIKQTLNYLSLNVPVVVLVIPHCIQTGPTYIERMKQLGAVVSDEHDITVEDYPLYRYLEKNLVDRRTTVVNSLNWLQEQESDNLYYPSDPHLNPVGQQLLGDSLIQVIQSLISIH